MRCPHKTAEGNQGPSPGRPWRHGLLPRRCSFRSGRRQRRAPPPPVSRRPSEIRVRAVRRLRPPYGPAGSQGPPGLRRNAPVPEIIDDGGRPVAAGRRGCRLASVRCGGDCVVGVEYFLGARRRVFSRGRARTVAAPSRTGDAYAIRGRVGVPSAVADRRPNAELVRVIAARARQASPVQHPGTLAFGQLLHGPAPRLVPVGLHLRFCGQQDQGWGRATRGPRVPAGRSSAH